MRWMSPYQTIEYSDALDASGVVRVTQEKPRIYYDCLVTQELTAWETDLEGIPPFLKGKVVNFSGIFNYDEVHWQEGAYYTAIVDLERPRFSSARQRNIRKAVRCGLDHAMELPENCQVFRDLETRAHIPLDVFNRLITNLIPQYGDYHSISKNGEIVAAAVVLRSEEIANIRFISSSQQGRECQAGALLSERIISYYHQRGFRFIDLSGISGPESPEKLENIDRFKLGFTQCIGVFTAYDTKKT